MIAQLINNPKIFFQKLKKNPHVLVNFQSRNAIA
jgi:hypothetical protein